MTAVARGWTLLFGIVLAACEADPSIYVDLRSDLVPGAEIAVAHTDVRSGTTVVASVDDDIRTDDLVRGARIAEINALPRGDYMIEVDLEGPDGAIVLSRRVLVTLLESHVVTIVASRSCVGVECPGPSAPAGATECIGGRCVDPSCQLPGEECGAPCTSATECGPPPSACAQMECTVRTCFAAPIPGACAAGEVCIPEDGCVPSVPITDGGLPDAGPPTCSTGCDDGNGCTADSCVDGACVFAPTSGGCDDGNACTHSDHCEGGGCTGTSYSCSPPPCMSASCDGSGGCSLGGGCGGGTTCDGSGCVACGGADQRCCDGGGCNGGLWCYTGVCTCGQRGGPCCPWDNSCESGATCNGGTCCVDYLGDCSSGAPCCGGVPCQSGICFNGT